MWVDEGELLVANLIKTNVSLPTLLLFQNNLTPVAGTVYSGLTLATFSGYAAVTPVFGTPVIDGAGKASMTAAPITFSHNGGVTSNNIYGFAFITNAPGAQKILTIQRLASAPKVMAVSGDTLTITLTLRDYQP